MACIPSLGITTDQVIKRISMKVNAARSSALSAPKAKVVLKIALDTQRKTSSFVLLAAGFSFLFGLFSLLLLQIDLKKIQRKLTAARKIIILKRLMLCFVWTSTALVFGAAFATTQLAKVIQHTSSTSGSVVSNSLVVEGGTGVQVLQWLAASFSFLASAGVSSIFMDAGKHRQLISKEPANFERCGA
ncbi:MAG: hypothetical protein Q9207_005089 [Kuettlingeria erythrocarpa]